MAITPIYGWVTPTPTSFVTQLPADFETFADAVDATVNDVAISKNNLEIATIMAAI
jgi:hypothetical protein